MSSSPDRRLACDEAWAERLEFHRVHIEVAADGVDGHRVFASCQPLQYSVRRGVVTLSTEMPQEEVHRSLCVPRARIDGRVALDFLDDSIDQVVPILLATNPDQRDDRQPGAAHLVVSTADLVEP